MNCTRQLFIWIRPRTCWNYADLVKTLRQMSIKLNVMPQQWQLVLRLKQICYWKRKLETIRPNSWSFQLKWNLFYIFSVRLLSVLRGHSCFFIPTTTANDIRLRRIFYPRFYPLHLFSSPWLGIEPGTSSTRYQDSTTRLSRIRWQRINFSHFLTPSIKQTSYKGKAIS